MTITKLLQTLANKGLAVEVYPNAFNGDSDFGPDRYVVKVMRGYQPLGEWEEHSVSAGLSKLQLWWLQERLNF